jgi:riboflavin biosynthesis pyrimidine reductase
MPDAPGAAGATDAADALSAGTDAAATVSAGAGADAAGGGGGFGDGIRSLPVGAGALDAEALWELYAPEPRERPWLRVNFVQSLDGSASVQGLSGGLGGPADKEVFDTLRGLADVVLVGAGTARAEGYGALRVREEHRARRLALGLPAEPAMALVSGRLDLDAASDLFAKAPRRPLVFTTETATAGHSWAMLEPVAELIVAGTDRVDPSRVVQELHDRGLTQILCEGGPAFFGDLIAHDLVDELCLTISPLLEGGHGPRIATPPRPDPAEPVAGTSDRPTAGTSAPPAAGPVTLPLGFGLVHVLTSGSMLLTRWQRDRIRDAASGSSRAPDPVPSTEPPAEEGSA